MAPVLPCNTQNSFSTAGEVFPPTTFIELVRGSDVVSPRLLLWNGQQVVGDTVEHDGRQYIPRTIHNTILRQLTLPERVAALESTPDLLKELSNLLREFVGLSEKFSQLIGRFVLATWIVDTLRTAPRLLVENADAGRSQQLLDLLHCVCRRALPMSGVSPGGFYSLPSEMQFTLLLRQPSLSPGLATVFQGASTRGVPSLRNGELRDWFGAQVIFCNSGSGEEMLRPSSIQLSCTSIGGSMVVMDEETKRRITENLQPKLLAFRFAHYATARSHTFDCSKFAPPLQELARTLATATPDSTELQEDLHKLLHDENLEFESANWVDPNTVIVEAILVHCLEAKARSVYVGDITDMAQEILAGRGEDRRLDPGNVGRRMKSLGFSTEPHDAKGVKLRLTNDVCNRVSDLARQLNVPTATRAACRDVGNVGGSSKAESGASELEGKG